MFPAMSLLKICAGDLYAIHTPPKHCSQPFYWIRLNLSAAYAQRFGAAILHKNNFLLSTHPDYCVQN